jgi:hypothetical protein
MSDVLHDDRDQDRIAQIKTAIMRIVEDFSGGLKFTDLVFQIALMVSENVVPAVKPDELEKIVRDCPELKVLTYTWKSMNREKMFVYME